MSTGAQFSDQPLGAPPADGNAGSSFLAQLLSGSPEDSAQAKRINEAGQQLKTLAENGGFAVNDEALTRYTKVCDTFLDGYGHIRRDAWLLAKEAPMGSSPYAYQAAAFNVTVANGDERSLIPNLELMNDGFQKAREALQIARRNYREADEAHNQTFRALNESL